MNRLAARPAESVRLGSTRSVTRPCCPIRRRKVRTAAERATLSRVTRRRFVVDYALQRRAMLAGLRNGRTGTWELCDAQPYLLAAARHHGEPTSAPCPICASEALVRVNYVYGDDLRHVSGQAKRAGELDRLAENHEFSVYAVEVCQRCGWNFLTTSYLLGPEAAVSDSPDPSNRRTASARR